MPWIISKFQLKSYNLLFDIQFSSLLSTVFTLHINMCLSWNYYT